MVLDHDTDAAITRATIRATARNIRATQVDAVAAGYDRTVYYECGAFSHTGSHRVALSYTVDGVTAVCDCEAGQQGWICQHVAAALMAEEMPQAEPDLTEQIAALAERIRRYWTTELGTWAEYDALRARLREMRSRGQAEPVAQPWKDPNFISTIMNPGSY